jgi:hypothetical protein
MEIFQIAEVFNDTKIAGGLFVPLVSNISFVPTQKILGTIMTIVIN